MTEAGPRRRSFAELLSHLIAHMHPADRGPYSYREIAAGIRGLPGAMTAAHINQLALGRRDNPRIHQVEALAWFLGAPVGYFFDKELAAKFDDQISEIIAWRDDEARHIAARVAGLNPRDRHAVTSLIDSLDAYEEQPRARRQRRKPPSR